MSIFGVAKANFTWREVFFHEQPVCNNKNPKN